MHVYQLNAFADEAGVALEKQIAAMRRNGVAGLEIRTVDGKNVTELTVDEARQIYMTLRDNGLNVWAIGSPIGKIDVRDELLPHLELLKHTLDLADALHTKRIRMFSFYLPSGDDPAAWRGAVLERLNRMLEIAGARGIALCHENEKGIYGDNAARCLDLHRAIPALKGVFDPANFVQCGQEPWAAWQVLSPYVDYMHVKDALWDGSVVPAGKGDGSVAKLLNAYLSQGGRALTLEPHLKVFDGLAALEKGEQGRGVGGRYVYPDNDAAFDAAANALKSLLGGMENGVV